MRRYLHLAEHGIDKRLFNVVPETKNPVILDKAVDVQSCKQDYTNTLRPMPMDYSECLENNTISPFH